MRGIGFVILGFLIMIGCAGSNQNQVTPVINFKPPQYQRFSYKPTPGSLFNPGYSYNVFSDRRASRIGDIVLVKIVESATAETKAETKADKTGENSFSVGAFFGKRNVLGLPIPVGGSPVFSTSTKNKFDNDTSTSREVTITATIAARVVNVLPNGLLEIQGYREIKINNENQLIVLSGLIRPIDIESDNSITSDKIADAHIKLIGRGIISEKQKPGWLTRLLDYVWPF